MSSQITSDILIAANDLTENSSTPNHNVGERAVTPDGRSFRYVKAGAVALVPGKLYQASAEVTANQDLAFAAAAVGAVQVTTTTTVTVTANQYAGGWLVVTVTPGQGYQYKIKSHPAATAATVVLTLEDPLVVAFTTSTRADLVANPFNGVIVNPTTATSAPVGVAVTAVTAAYYGWLQVGGPATILADGAITVGVNVSASNAVAGAVEAAVTAQGAVGIALTGIADTQYGAVQMTLR